MSTTLEQFVEEGGDAVLGADVLLSSYDDKVVELLCAQAALTARLPVSSSASLQQRVAVVRALQTLQAGGREDLSACAQAVHSAFFPLLLALKSPRLCRVYALSKMELDYAALGQQVKRGGGVDAGQLAKELLQRMDDEDAQYEQAGMGSTVAGDIEVALRRDDAKRWVGGDQLLSSLVGDDELVLTVVLPSLQRVAVEVQAALFGPAELDRRRLTYGALEQARKRLKTAPAPPTTTTTSEQTEDSSSSSEDEEEDKTTPAVAPPPPRTSAVWMDKEDNAQLERAVIKHGLKWSAILLDTAEFAFPSKTTPAALTKRWNDLAAKKKEDPQPLTQPPASSEV